MKSSEAWSLAEPESSSAEADAIQPDLAAALHEVSNALTVVLGWLDGARSSLPESPEREALEIALAHARLGYRIARRAIGADVSDVERERCAAAVARDAVLAVTPEARRRRVQVRFVDRARGNELVSDAPSVLQILLNLMLNALAFSPADATVTLTASRDGDHVLYEVADEGPGIAPERAHTLLSGPDSTRRGGAGIGLRHCAALAEQSGGRLELARFEAGTTFALAWPVTVARTDSRPPPSLRRLLSGSRLLVVEDDAAVLGLLELALESRGATLVVARTRDELDERLAAGERFSAALIDLSPLGEQAKLVLADLAVQRGMPIVLISGFASGAPVDVEQHVRAWVRKPFEMDELVEVLSAVMSER